MEILACRTRELLEMAVRGAGGRETSNDNSKIPKSRVPVQAQLELRVFRAAEDRRNRDPLANAADSACETADVLS